MANPITSALSRILRTFSSNGQKTEPISKQEDISLAIGNNPSVLASSVKSRTKILGKTLSHEFQGGTRFKRPGVGEFARPVYDLSEIARAADVEPYVDQSIRKHREMILKEGYEVEGGDDQMVGYIKERLFEMSLVTGIPTESWIREGITNLVKYHNSGFVLRRDFIRSKGRPIRMYGKKLDPIAGIFILDPTTVSVKVDKYGTPKKWQQTLHSSGGTGNSIKRFNPEDVIFVTLDKNTGFTFGTPYILPTLDDVRALRRLEELAVILASKEVFPLYHYRIGTDALPAMQYEGGADEVSDVRAEIMNLPLQGNLVTSHRHEVTLVSKDGGALDLTPFLEYFEARVMAGLRLSPLDVGRGGSANRACYSGDTETLTDKGWKNHWDIDIENDKIGTFNPDTRELEFHKADGKHVYPYSGNMYNFKTRMSDIMVTPDHDMWLSFGKKGKWQKVHAEDIPNDKPFRFQSQAEWKEQGTKLEPMVLGNHPEIPADTWLRFLAYFIKYGKVTPSRNEMKLIVRSRPVSETLEEFIKSLPFEFRTYDNESYVKFAINDIELVKHLSMVCSCRVYPKKIPSYVMDSSIEDMKLFLDELIPSEPFDGAIIYYSRTYSLAGQVQEIAFKLGYQARVLEDTRKPRVMISMGQDTEEVDPKADIKQVDYEGDVYCFEVPNHLFVTRRNGKIAIQGNTASNINKNVQDAAKDYQQAFSTALSFGMFLPLLLEGGFNVNSENMVFLTFPAIDREELRAHQNHGLQMALGNQITCTEFRKKYLNLAKLSEEEKEDTTRAADAAVDEKLTRVAAAVKPAATTSSSSTARKSTATSTKTANNKGQPRNQSGSKPAKTRIKANDYRSSVRSEFDRFRDKMIALIESDEDEVDVQSLDTAIRNCFGQFVTSCMTCGKKYLEDVVDIGADMALEQDDSQEEYITVGRRAMSKFYTNCVEKSFWKSISPYRDQICVYIIPDEDGNSSRYMAYGALSSMWISLERLTGDQSETAKRFGFAKAARKLGYVNIALEKTESGDRKTIEINKGPIVYRNLMPTIDEGPSDLRLGSKLIEEAPDDGE